MTEARVSAHGCHSRDYCSHADDPLEDILQAYCDQGYAWVGVTEHMPVDDVNYIWQDESAEGYTLASLSERFEAYAAKVRALKSHFEGRLGVIFGFETEVYPGYERQLDHLIARYQPEFLVGSVHIVNGIEVGSSETLRAATEAAGGIEALYADYFDTQLALIERFSPRVIGHFDYVRQPDTEYREHLALPDVWSRVERNLAAIKERNLTLDFNLAALRRGHDEPFPCEQVTRCAVEMGIPLVPGEDAHDVASVGAEYERATEWLRRLGGNCDWERPA